MRYHRFINKRLPNQFFIRVSSALLFFALLVSLLFALYPSSNRVTCTVQFEKENQLQLFYAPELAGSHFNEKDSVYSKKVPGGEIQKIVLPLANVPVAHLRLDTGDKPGTIKLYQIEIFSRTQKPRILNHEEIFKSFKAGHSDVQLTLHDDHLAIQADSNDPYIYSTGEFTKRPWLLLIGIPAIFSLLLYNSLGNTDSGKLKKIFAATKKPPSHGTNYDALDGLRGFAALLVVADHTCARFIGVGASGVWIFMTLSGFLLAKPFIVRPESVLSVQTMKTFFLRRCQRIFPAYYTYIGVVYLLQLSFDEALQHFLFLKGNGHLWVVPQEVVFYVLIPGIFIFNFLILKRKTLFQATLTISLAVLTNIFLTINVVSLYGMANQKLRLYFGIFLLGIAASYIHEWIMYNIQKESKKSRIVTKAASIGGPLCLLLLVFGSSMRLYGGTEVFAQIYFGWFGALAALLVLCITLSPNSWLSAVLTWKPLLSLGVVSFSFYLTHPLVLNIL